MRNFQFESRLPIDSLQKLLDDIQALRAEKNTLGHTWYFRGDRTSDALKPSIGQELKYAGKKLIADDVVERKFLNRFKRYAYQQFNRIDNDWEALFLARHYELPTRILDWTTNPLVALYFACSPAADAPVPGVVWGILRFPDETHDIDILDPRNRPLDLYPGNPTAIKMIYPVYNSARITAQKGVFSWHSHPHVELKSFAGQSFDDDKLDIAHLAQWPVDTSKDGGSIRTRIIQELENLGINQRMIFPDLIGITRGIWQTEVLWNGS